MQTTVYLLIKIVFILITGKSISQNYYPFPENNSFWTVVEYSLDKSTSNDFIEVFEINGDSVVNSVTYKKVFKLLKDENGIDTLSSLHCLMRQDVNQKRIYFIRSYLDETTEKLGYDFDISIGDTVVLPAFDYYEMGDTIFTVNHYLWDSIQLYNGNYRKIYNLYSIMNTNYELNIIEGVGDMNSPFPNIEFWNGFPLSEMLCLTEDNEYIFVQSNDPDASCGFDLIESVSDFRKNPIRYFPNPTFKGVSFIIPSSYFNSDIVISIHSLDGCLIDEYKYANLQTEIIQVDFEVLSGGIYILTLKSNDLTQYVDKLIINK